MQELEGQRGEGAYFREDTVHVFDDREHLNRSLEIIIVENWL